MDAADLVIERFWERERPGDQLTALFAGGWPAFIDADQAAAAHLPRIRQLFADWEFALVDPAGSQLVAAGWGCHCGGTARSAAAAGGLVRVVAPLRPTGKHRHPLTSIEPYAAWTRDDGTASDGWLRSHLAMGGRMVATTPASQTFTAPVTSWEQWSGLSMPTSGTYLVPDALAPLVVDAESGVGTLTEPGIWVQHR